MDAEETDDVIRIEILEVRIEKDYSLKQHNTFGIDAKCAQFVEYSS